MPLTDLTLRHLGIVVFLGTGSVLVLVGIVRLLAAGRTRDPPGRGSASSRPENTAGRPGAARAGHPWLVYLLLAAVVGSGLLLRLDALGSGSVNHPEMLVPGIPLAEGISVPPQRLSLSHTVTWHFHGEPHPPAYFFLMYPWTRTVGTSEAILRLPSALFGAATVILLFVLGRQTATRGTALLAAALLAFNAHHIYWSQQARLYAFSTLLAVASTVLLVRLYRREKPGRWHEAGYVGVTWLGLATQMLFWPLLAGQWLWVALAPGDRRRWAGRIHALQALIVVLGAPLVAHAVYRAYSSFLAEPSIGFIRHFLSFGFLTLTDPWSIPPRASPVWLGVALTTLALVALGTSLLRAGPLSRRTRGGPDSPPSLPPGRLVPVAIGSSLLVLGLSLYASRRQELMALVAALPFLALAIPWIGRGAASLAESVRERTGRGAAAPAPDFVLASVPPLIVVLVSFFVPLLAARQFLLFVPFLLLLIARGVWSWRRAPLVAAGLLVGVAVAHAGALSHFKGIPMSNRDYKTLAERMKRASTGGEAVYVRANDWATTPLFYYVRPERFSLVTSGFDRAAEARARNGIWIVEFEGRAATPEMLAAVEDLEKSTVVTALRASATRYRAPRGAE